MPYDPVDRVRKLRAQADGTTFEPEAQSCRSKALKLMAQHGLTEAQVAPPPPVQHVFQQPFMWGPTGFGFPQTVFFTHTMANQQVIVNAFQEGFNSAGGGNVIFNIRFTS